MAAGAGGPPGFGGLSVLVGWFCLYTYASAVTDIALSTVADKPVRIGAVLHDAAANAMPVMGLSLLLWLGTLAGMALLIVPGLMFAAVFAVTVPAYICEKPGFFGAFGRSRALTRGHRWGILVLWLAVWLGLFVILRVGGVMARSWVVNGGSGDLVTGLMIALFVAFFWYGLMGFSAVLNAAVYTVLRVQRGEEPTGDIEKVFE